MKELKRDIRILIAEDDYLVGEMVKGVVGEIGYTIAGQAFNGLEAMDLTESLQPDVVIMDIKMPDMDGIEATHLIYERCPTPVVVLTAYETPDLLKRASAAGVGAYLVKPPNPREMERAVVIAMARFADIIELRRLNQELETRYAEREKLITKLQAAMSKVKMLSGLLPICASCKKIRDDQGYWHQVEVYIRDHAEVEFSHGLCPECAKKFYPDYFKDE